MQNGRCMLHCGYTFREFVMTSIELKSRADENGIVNLSISLGTADAHREVRVDVISDIYGRLQ